MLKSWWEIHDTSRKWSRSKINYFPHLYNKKHNTHTQPRLTLSKTLNASLISSSLSVSFIFLAIIVRNSGKSMVPLPKEGQSEKKLNIVKKGLQRLVRQNSPFWRWNQHTICVHLIDHVLEFGLSWVLTQWPHDSAQLLSGDGPISVLIKQGEGLLELWTGTRRGGVEKYRRWKKGWKKSLATSDVWWSMHRCRECAFIAKDGKAVFLYCHLTCNLLFC